MKLYCVRHGEAEQSPNAQSEPPLTPEGRQGVMKVANYLARQGVQVSRVFHSSKLRAKQTADILAQALVPSQKSEISQWLEPESEIAPFLSLIESWGEDTVIVGHMPFMPRLVSALVTGDEEATILRFPPGTVVCIQRDDKQNWQLNWILSPGFVPD